jgi:hypothetical protein
MTFTPGAGVYKGEGQKKFGKFLDFDRSTYKQLLLPRLNAVHRRETLNDALVRK